MWYSLPMITHRIDLDMGGDCDHLRLVHEICRRHNVFCVLLQEQGPAGGNPLYRFVGDQVNLMQMVHDEFHAGKPGDEHSSWLVMTHIKKL